MAPGRAFLCAPSAPDPRVLLWQPLPHRARSESTSIHGAKPSRPHRASPSIPSMALPPRSPPLSVVRRPRPRPRSPLSRPRSLLSALSHPPRSRGPVAPWWWTGSAPWWPRCSATMASRCWSTPGRANTGDDGGSAFTTAPPHYLVSPVILAKITAPSSVPIRVLTSSWKAEQPAIPALPDHPRPQSRLHGIRPTRASPRAAPPRNPLLFPNILAPQSLHPIQRSDSRGGKAIGLNPSYCYAPAARSPLLRACTRTSSLTLFARMREVSASLIHIGELLSSSWGRAGSARRRTGSAMGGASRDPHWTLFLHADTMQLSFRFGEFTSYYLSMWSF
jgi:hypothetical protein